MPKILDEKHLIYEIFSSQNKGEKLNFNSTKITSQQKSPVRRRRSLFGFGPKKKVKHMTQVDWCIYLNNQFLKQKVVGLGDKKVKDLLSSFIKERIPVELRAHAYLILSGGFTYMEGQRAHGVLDYDELLNKGWEDEKTVK
jgi:hypothetical protein